MRTHLILSLLLTLIAFLAQATPSSTLHFDPLPPVQDAQPCRTEIQYKIRPWHFVTDWLTRVFGNNESDHAKSERILAPPASPTTIPTGLIAAYQDQVVARFVINDMEEAEALKEATNILFLDIWEAANGYVDIRLAKSVLPSLIGLLPRSMQKPQKMIFQGADLATAVSETYPTSTKDTQVNNPFQARKSFGGASSGTAQTSVFFREYRPLSVMQPWMRILQSLFSTHVRLVTIGRSYEGRDILGMRVGVHPTNDDRPLGPRKTLVITGGSHAREWISTSTVNFVMYSLITAYGRNEGITRMLQDMDFLFVPTMNPDGYVYTWEVDRLWRKTRQPTPIRFCRGIDMDRSWGFHWGSDESDSSSNPCSEDYAGSEPFASVESAAIARFLRNETENNGVHFLGLLDLHSYSQSILLPYAFSCAEDPPALEDLEELGEGMSREIRRTYGEYYDVVSACEGNMLAKKGAPKASDTSKMAHIQSAGGNPLDWFYHELGIRYSFQIKLRDMGSYGFLLPPEYIVPQGEEIYNAVMSLVGSLLASDNEASAKSDEFVRQNPLAGDSSQQKPLFAT